MKRTTLFIAILLGCLLVAGSSFAQSGQVSIEQVSSLIDNYRIQAGQPARILLRVSNTTGEKCDVSNGFKISSPDAADWDSVTMDSAGELIITDEDIVDPFPAVLHNRFVSFFDVAFVLYGGVRIGADGMGADTVGILGVGLPSRSTNQMPIGYSDTALAVTIWMSKPTGQAGKHVCLDSAFWGIGGTWVWVGASLAEYYPEFHGLPNQPYSNGDGNRLGSGFCFGLTYGGPPPAVDTVRVPSDYATIQAGVDAVVTGGVVLVSPGTYSEAITITGKSIEVRSTDGPLVTIITGPSDQDLVVFSGNATNGSRLDGFTLLGGRIGVWCQNAAPRISHNILRGQHMTNWAAIVLAGALYGSSGASPAQVINNTIVQCTGGGLSSFSTAMPVIKNNIVAFNAKYGIHVDGDDPTDISYNDVFGNPVPIYNGDDPGPGALAVDPLLTGDYALAPESPCINAGDPDPAYNDPDHSRNDMGAVFFNGIIPPPPTADTVYVPTNYPTVQAAIDASKNGGVVLVLPGTYPLDGATIVIDSKSIALKSTEGPLATTITSNSTAPLIIVRGAGASGSVIEGFRLEGGLLGIWCMESGPTIRHNILYGQFATDWAAIALSGLGWGSLGPSPATIVNNTITKSTGGGISIYSTATPTIKNNIIAFNAKYGVHRDGMGPAAVPVMNYNDIFGNPIPMYNLAPGVGALAVDPQLNSDCTLKPGSPCINTGDPDPAYNDPDGSRTDMGAVFFGGGGSPEPIPTNEWIIVYCDHPTLHGQPISPGEVVTAYDPQNVLCGKAAVKDDGSLGLMLIYRDDQYTAADEGAGPGDHVTFRVGSEPVMTDPPVIWTKNGDEFMVCNFEKSVCQQIQLHAGWNLISWNVEYAGDIRQLLSGISSCVDLVMSFDQGGLVYDPDLEQYSTLNNVDYRHGYWFKMKCDAALQVCGNPAGPADFLPLNAGWNLVSYLSDRPRTPQDALFTVFDKLQVAIGFDGGAKIYIPNSPNFNTLTQLSPGFGYWIRLSAPDVLDYFFMPVSGSEDYGPTTMVASAGESLGSRVWMSLYGDHVTLDGAPLADNARIEAYTVQGERIGSALYMGGMLKFMPVYGTDEADAAAAKYAHENDHIYLKVNGVRVEPDIIWTGQGTTARLSALQSNSLPLAFALEQNYPNPFNPATTISFALPQTSDYRLSIYNVTGQKVTEFSGTHEAGHVEVEWNASGNASGIYFYKLTAGSFTASKKMILLK